MTDLQTLLLFFGSSAKRQVHLVPDLPRDRGVSDYFTGLHANPLVLLLDALRDEALPDDQEDREHYLQRTGMGVSAAVDDALRDIVCFAYLLKSALDSDNLWNQRSLENRREWSILRRLCSECGSDTSRSDPSDDMNQAKALMEIVERKKAAQVRSRNP